METNLKISAPSRKVNRRAPRIESAIEPPVQFSLQEIKQHFTDSITSVKEQFTVADSLLKDGNIEGCKTIGRSQIALAEGLLDFYLHEISKYCLFRMFTGQWAKSSKYALIMVPMQKVEEAIETSPSKDWFFSFLNETFSRQVFLSMKSMCDQLNLIGIGFNDVMVRAFPQDNVGNSISVGKKVVASLFERRNAIAHQNDRSHASAKQNDINKEFVIEYISKIESIVNAVQSIAEEKI